MYTSTPKTPENRGKGIFDMRVDEPTFDEYLEAICSGLPIAAAMDLRQERAAILEYCAGFSKPEAERRAGLRKPEDTQ
jgi:hypothetical protein